VQHRHHQQSHRPVQVDQPAHLVVGEQRVGVAPVGLHDRGPVVAGQDRSAVGHGDRVGVHVDHMCVGNSVLRDLVNVADRRDSGADLQELPDALVEEVTDRPAEECSVGLHDPGMSGHAWIAWTATSRSTAKLCEPPRK